MTEKFHIHIMNNRHQSTVYQVLEHQLAAALERHSDLLDYITVTMGSSEYDYPDWTEDDKRDYFEKMKTANVMMGYTFPTENLKEYAPNLKWIHFNSSGVEQITPFDWVPEDVRLTNSRGVHQPKSSESFDMYLLMMNARLPELYTAQRAGKWHRIFTSVMKGKKLVVIGVGCQGGEIAHQGKKKGMVVVGIDPIVKEHPYCDRVVTAANMREEFADADFVALSAPVTKDTYRIIGAEQISWLPQRAQILNVARGQLIVAEALDEALRKGTISGAILDVFDHEPLEQDSFFWTTPNLLFTPHVSSDDPVNYSPRSLDILFNNVRNYRDGKPLTNIVDTKREF